MRVVITGISGFVGQALRKHFESRGDEVVGLSIRETTPVREIVGTVEGSDVVINLAGANILAKWTESYKALLYSSRIETTRKLVKALEQCSVRPSVLLSASAVGIYENGAEADESSSVSSDFLASLCKDWEAEANEAMRFGMRVAIMRFGVIYGRGGGAMEKMLLPFKMGVGGKLGSGEQMVSWIHIADLVHAAAYIIEHGTLSGVFNFTSPNPVTNAEQTVLLGKVLQRPTLFTVPRFAVKLLFGEGSTVMLDSKAVYPKALLEAGFEFTFSTMDSALADIAT